MPDHNFIPIGVKFNNGYIPVTESGCWIWLGCLTKGYGTIHSRGKTMYAHRYSYEAHKGKIPDGLCIDHLCRVTCCVNPDHLEAVTIRENLRRGIGVTGNNARKTHCVNGHLFSEHAHLHANKDGSTTRMCRKCDADRHKRYRRDRRLAKNGTRKN